MYKTFWCIAILFSIGCSETVQESEVSKSNTYEVQRQCEPAEAVFDMPIGCEVNYGVESLTGPIMQMHMIDGEYATYQQWDYEGCTKIVKCVE